MLTSLRSVMAARHWSFTCFNIQDETYQQDIFNIGDIRYLLIGLEATQDGRPHLQCYVQFMRPQRLNYVTRLWPGCHAERSKGDPQSNIIYCKKKITLRNGVFLLWAKGSAQIYYGHKQICICP